MRPTSAEAEAEIEWERRIREAEKDGNEEGDDKEEENDILSRISCQSSLCLFAAPVRNICVQTTSINCLEDFWIALANELKTSSSRETGPTHC